MKRMLLLFVSSALLFFTVCHWAWATPPFDAEVYIAQEMLEHLGYDPGTVDGLWGKKTTRAVKAFQKERGLAVTGKLDADTLDALKHKKAPGSVAVMAVETHEERQVLSKVGYIDLKRLVSESRIGRQANVDLNKIKMDVEQELSQRRDALEKQEISSKEYERYVNDSREMLLNKEKELVNEILKKGDDILKQVAHEEKFTLVLKNANTIGFLNMDFDITDRVIQRLDALE